MRVVYSDESGCGSIKKEPLTVVAAIVLNLDRQWDTVEALLQVAVMGTPRNLLHGGVLKGNLLYSALRKSIPRADTTLKIVLETIPLQKIPVFFGAVDRAGCVKTHGPERKSPITEYRIAFDSCLSAVDHAASTFANSEKILWIAEESDIHREAASRSGQRFLELMKPSKWEGGKFVPSGERSSIVDTIYFGEKRHSRILQLADVCCSTICLHLLENISIGSRSSGRFMTSFDHQC